jgi:hypothetical protein
MVQLMVRKVFHLCLALKSVRFDGQLQTLSPWQLEEGSEGNVHMRLNSLIWVYSGSLEAPY